MALVHLSFDNGPHPEGTPMVLDVLARHRATASFFVLGKELATDQGADLARRIRDAGHRLGNHSYSHVTPMGEDPRHDAVELELGRTQELLDGIVDGPLYFRPFGGGGKLGPHLLSPAAVDWLTRRQATVVLWNVVPEDWIDAEAWPHKAIDAIGTQQHALVVLHDIVPAAMTRLDGFLHTLADQGHQLTDALPQDCLPLIDGQARPGLDAFVQNPLPGETR